MVVVEPLGSVVVGALVFESCFVLLPFVDVVVGTVVVVVVEVVPDAAFNALCADWI